jgi:hypothetical protein
VQYNHPFLSQLSYSLTPEASLFLKLTLYFYAIM